MNEHSKNVSLGDVVIERSERVDDPSSTGISRFIGLEHFDSGRLSINRFGTTDDLESAMKVCRAGDTLLARRNVYLKRASMTEFDAICSGDAIVLHETPDLVPGFLPIILNSTDFWDYANENADGSMSKRLSVKHLKGYRFHLPSKDEQLRVVNLVWKLERLDSSLSSMLSDLDLCIKSRFIEMFGNPVNSCKYPDVVNFSEVITSIINGMGSPPPFSSEGFAFIRATNIQSGEIDESDMLYIDEATSKKLEKYRVKTGDFIFVRSGAYAGDVAVIPEKYNNQFGAYDINVSVDQSRVNPVFLNILFNSDYSQVVIKPLTSRSAQPHLNTKQVQSLPIFIPPIELQNQFADFVKQVDKSKFMLKKHIEDTKSLQQAIINKCFEANDDV